MTDPKLTIAIAIHQGAIALMVDHGEGSMAPDIAISRSLRAFKQISEEVHKEDEV